MYTSYCKTFFFRFDGILPHWSSIDNDTKSFYFTGAQKAVLLPPKKQDMHRLYHKDHVFWLVPERAKDIAIGQF